MGIPFLAADWQNLVVANFVVEPEVVAQVLPAGLVADEFETRQFVSVVAFGFRRTRMLGLLPVPGATSFEEINLRFYVRRQEPPRRGVVFVREVVPSRLVAGTARALFNEPYSAFPTSYAEEAAPGSTTYRYGWRTPQGELVVAATREREWRPLAPGSFEEFILEHYWGYNQHPSGDLVEYRVDHPPWRWAPAAGHELGPGLAEFYPRPFRAALSREPHSVFIAEGSRVRVFAGERLQPAIRGAQPGSSAIS